MGQDRIADHLQNGAEVITSTDMSCLMHLEGIVKRNNHPLKIKHIAEILNSI
jgi:L-lactate dehydrogenase complex protein LldE